LGEEYADSGSKPHKSEQKANPVIWVCKKEVSGLDKYGNPYHSQSGKHYFLSFLPLFLRRASLYQAFAAADCIA